MAGIAPATHNHVYTLGFKTWDKVYRSFCCRF